MEKLTIIFDVAEEIMAGLKSGKYLQKGGVIVDSQTHRVVKWLNEASASKISAVVQASSVAQLGFTPAIIASTLINISGFMFMNYKLNKIQEQLTEIQKQLQNIQEQLKKIHIDVIEIKEIVSETQEYEIGKLFADFKTYLQEARFFVLENKAEKLLGLRSEFLKIANRVQTLIDMIQRKGKIIILREIFMQYVKLYDACIECAVRCSMAGEEYHSAQNLISDSGKIFIECQKNYRQAFINASANEVANISYNDIQKLQEDYLTIKFMNDCLESDKLLIDCLKEKKFTYFEFESKMNELQSSDKPAMLILE